MAYDSVRHVVVLFGGEGPLGDTWEWDGNTWTQKAVTGPSARDESAMVFDSARGVVVLFGGGDHNSPQAEGETWEYPVGGTWVRRANSAGPGATTGPSPRVRHAMAYDSTRGVVVLFGGLDASGPGGSLVAKADTWQWNGTAWTLRATTGPAARTSHAMAHDSARGETVLFGGFGDIIYSDTWAWDGTAWTQKATTGPSARFDHAMAYAGSCPRTMLFAGYDGNPPDGRVDDNWEWDGTVWTQLSTGPSARNGHKMAYDIFRRRFVLFGGYSLPAGQNAETWEYVTVPPVTFRGGRNDDFALPTDPAGRSTRLDAALPAVTWTAFDDTTSNRYLGHTFSNLPANIMRAELIIRMKPLAGEPNNDSLHLGLLSGPPAMWAWQLNLRNLPGAGGTWNVGVNPATTFNLDLGNLPTGVSILTKLATDRYLDLMAQDDTVIDRVDLRVWTCPSQDHFFGLGHTALGTAVLAGINGGLVVSNLGGGGNDGVAVSPGDSQGFSLSSVLDPNTVPIGAYEYSALTGTVNGIPTQELGGTRITRLSDGFEFEHDFQADTASPTYTIEVFNGANLVYTRDFAMPPPGSVEVPILKGIWKWLTGGGSFERDCEIFTANVTLPDGTVITVKYKKCKTSVGLLSAVIEGGGVSDPVTGDLFQLSIRTPVLSSILINNVHIVAAGMPEMRLSSERVGLFGFSFQARGLARLHPQTDFFWMDNLGSNGQDGVTINFGRVDSFNIGLDAIVDTDGNELRSIGAYLEANAIGSLNGVPDQSLGVARITQAEVGNYAITANFTAIGSQTQHVQVFNQGALVADFPGHTGPIGTASAWMSGVGKLGGPTESFVCHWPPSTSFVISGAGINGTSYVGDEIHILAEGATQSTNYRSALQLSTAGMPELTIADAQAALKPATLGNISTRLQVGTADRVMIAGFIVQGGAPKKVLIRAAGPSLTQLGVPNALANPRLELHDTNNTIGVNDNWQTTQIGGVITSDQVAAIQSSGLAPGDQLESAIIATLLPGSYTAIVQGVNGGTGVGIAEVYDLDPTNGSLLANISTRGFVQTADNVMIGGFIVVTQPTRMIARAIGPSLTQFGVPDALANPTLELHDSNGVLVIANNDWQDNPAQAAQLTAAGLAPTNALESGLAATLSPGLYTALVAGVNNTTGNALVEVYVLP